MFAFKQFTIYQDRCAQKVSEVACIQGAWTQLRDDCKHVLDIGSGTGLLSLMLAQRFDVQIDAFEIDEETFRQGKENIAASPFANRIECIHNDIKKVDISKTYDFIICNPPFYEHQLKSLHHQTNIAKHSTELTLDDLLKVCHSTLNDNGACSILIPFEREIEFINLCCLHGFYIQTILRIKHTLVHKPKVIVILFSRQNTEINYEELIVKEGGVYTKKMSELMNDFYL